MNVIAEIQRINEYELEKGLVGTAASWHAKYADSAWVYVGNLPLNLTEGDVICILSQFGEVRVRDQT
jgi:RNA-binding motif protein, X-linked 2